MIAQLILGLLVACSLFAQTQVELTKQVKGELPPEKGGTGVSSCLENEGLVWQSGEFACSALASGPHAPTHQHGGAEEVGTSVPANDAVPKAGGGGTLAEGWIPASISHDNESPAPGDISGSLAAGYIIAPNAVRSAELDQSDNYTLTGAVNTKVLNQVRHTEQFDWIQDPGTAISVGLNTVTLSPCPSGVDGSWPNHYIWINDNTNALDEAVLITAGTCTSGAPSGTINFSAANAHTAGAYIFESASDGVQECINALPRATLKPNGGICVMPARELLWQQTVSIGNGTTSTKSDLFAVRLLGQGTGEVNAAAEATTQLSWVGPANGTMLRVRGFIVGVELGHFRIHAQSSADINLHLSSFNWSWIHDLVILNTGADGVAMKTRQF